MKSVVVKMLLLEKYLFSFVQISHTVVYLVDFVDSLTITSFGCSRLDFIQTQWTSSGLRKNLTYCTIFGSKMLYMHVLMKASLLQPERSTVEGIYTIY